VSQQEDQKQAISANTRTEVFQSVNDLTARDKIPSDPESSRDAPPACDFALPKITRGETVSTSKSNEATESEEITSADIPIDVIGYDPSKSCDELERESLNGNFIPDVMVTEGQTVRIKAGYNGKLICDREENSDNLTNVVGKVMDAFYSGPDFIVHFETDDGKSFYAKNEGTNWLEVLSAAAIKKTKIMERIKRMGTSALQW